MTPHPQPEYIITEAQVKRIVGLNLHDNAQKLVEEIRSRPHTPVSEPAPSELPDNYWYCPFREGKVDCESWCEWPCDEWAIWHDQRVASAAREDERAKVLTFIQSNQTRIDFDDPDEFFDLLQLMKSDEGMRQLKSMGWNESLRQQEEP